MFFACSQGCRSGVAPGERRSALALLVLGSLSILGLKLLMVETGFSFASVAAGAVAFPLLLHAYALRLRWALGPAIVGASWILALAMFAPALVLDYPGWAAEMPGTALGALSILFLLGLSRSRIPPRAMIVTALIAGAALALAAVNA